MDPSVPFLNRALHLQFDHWLPEDILTKQDKMSMAHGIEARVPFLDHDLVKYVMRVPPKLTNRAGQTKILLRQYAEWILPTAVTSRRKMPFYVPLDKHYREPAFQDLMDRMILFRTSRSGIGACSEPKRSEPCANACTLGNLCI